MAAPGRPVAASRDPAVAGAFYPDDPDLLASLVDDLVSDASLPADAGAAVHATGLAGILVPHAGLSYSGAVAAVGWRLLAERMGDDRASLVILGTNHSAWWLDGVGVWDRAAWRTPLGEVAVDEELADAIVKLGPPFAADRGAHEAEHSIEVQLPFVHRLLAGARIVPLAVGAGRGGRAVTAGERLGRLLAARRAAGVPIALVISTDMAHYPPAAVGRQVTETLAPVILELDALGLARREAELSASGLPGLACGLCGIEPTVLGLATLRSLGVSRGLRLAAATSAEAGGSTGRTVGYLAVAFPD